MVTGSNLTAFPPQRRIVCQSKEAGIQILQVLDACSRPQRVAGGGKNMAVADAGLISFVPIGIVPEIYSRLVSQSEDRLIIIDSCFDELDGFHLFQGQPAFRIPI